jgi:hypothetical protein
LIDRKFDERSFSLESSNRDPTVAFAVPGRGNDDAGNLVELDPLNAESVAWWKNVRGSLAVSDTSGKTDVDRWAGRDYTVIARYDSTGDIARMSIADSQNREFNIATIAGPIRRIDWLDNPSITKTERDALARAFNQAARYDESVRVASITRRDGWRLVAAKRQQAVATNQTSHSLALRSSLKRTPTCQTKCANAKPSTRAGTKRRSS